MFRLRLFFFCFTTHLRIEPVIYTYTHNMLTKEDASLPRRTLTKILSWTMGRCVRVWGELQQNAETS